MQDTARRALRTERRVKRIARGMRMPASLWAFVDETAEATGERNGGRLIERWVREKYEAVRRVA